MSTQDASKTVGEIPVPPDDSASSLPSVLTTLVWLGWFVCLSLLTLHIGFERTWAWAGIVMLDGLTLVMWTTATFFSGIVHSYSCRYMMGDRHIDAFFGRIFVFTVAIMVLVAADHVALFAAAWAAMGWLMAGLIGHVREWEQARRSASMARRYFGASSLLVAIAVAVLAWTTGTSAISEIGANVAAISATPRAIAIGALVLAAMIQSALVPFHTWLLSSMTAPTPASALMHAGFVNAGGILLLRFARVVSIDPVSMGLIVAIGAVSALLGKLLKSVRADVKRQLGCSTIGQMGFMLMQAGLGFFAAAIAHLILHGCYKAYLFLSSGEQVEHANPRPSKREHSMGMLGWLTSLVAAVAGGAIFVFLTGKGTQDSGLLLTLLVVLTTFHAARSGVRYTSVSGAIRYLVVPLVFLPTIAIYASMYVGISGILSSSLPVVTEPAELTLFHAIVGGLFVLAYLAIETEIYQKSERLYVELLNATRPPSDTVLTSKEAYREY